MTAPTLDEQIEWADHQRKTYMMLGDEFSMVSMEAILATLRSVKQAEPLRDQLISAAALAVASERKGLYKGAAWVADCILDNPHAIPEQAEPVAWGIKVTIAGQEMWDYIAQTRTEANDHINSWLASDEIKPEAHRLVPLYAAPAAPQSGRRDPDALVKQMVAHGINKHLARDMVHAWLDAPGREG